MLKAEKRVDFGPKIGFHEILSVWIIPIVVYMLLTNMIHKIKYIQILFNDFQ